MARRGGITLGVPSVDALHYPVGILPVDALHAPHRYDKYFTGSDTKVLVANRKTRELRLIPVKHEEGEWGKLRRSDLETTMLENYDNNDVTIAVQISAPVVGYRLFYHDFIHLTYVKLLEGVKQIEEEAFFSTNIQEIVIPPSVLIIGQRAIAYTSLFSVTIHPIQVMFQHVFEGCHKLTTVKLVEGMEYISSSTFKLCDSLRSINIPSSVKSIRSRAFASCSNLVVVRLHTGLIEIEGEAFYKCESLKVIVIPASVTSIGFRVFEWCKSLEFIVNLSAVELSTATHGYFYSRTTILKSFNELYNQAPDLYHLYFPELRARFYTAVGLRENGMPNELSALIMGMVGRDE